MVAVAVSVVVGAIVSAMSGAAAIAGVASAAMRTKTVNTIESLYMAIPPCLCRVRHELYSFYNQTSTGSVVVFHRRDALRIIETQAATTTISITP